MKIVENSQKESSKSKKETITFSLEQDVLQEIRKDAQRQGLSINSIVNNILRKYVFFFKYAEYDQPILIPNKSFQVILNDIDETKQIEEYKAILTDLIPAIFMQEKIPFSFDNWIKYVFGSMLMYAGAYQNFSYHKDEEGHLCLVFKHNFGIKWSRIISSAYCHCIENVMSYHTTATLLPSIVTIKIMEKSAADIVISE